MFEFNTELGNFNITWETCRPRATYIFNLFINLKMTLQKIYNAVCSTNAQSLEEFSKNDVNTVKTFVVTCDNNFMFSVVD